MVFIHAADLHLDSPLQGLSRYEGAPVDQMRLATRQALDRLVALAKREAAAFVTISGDVYDGDWKDFGTGLFFASRMAQLVKAGIRVFIVSGNHDAQSQISRTLTLPDGVKFFDASRAETVVLGDHGVAIHGQSFAERSCNVDLSAAYPDPEPGLFNIGMLHTSLDGREGHDVYAPCTLSGLVSKGYDYWALGHVHRREEVCREPWVVFPGNLQGRHAREIGAKGCTVVTVDQGRVRAVVHRDLDVARWVRCEVDATGAREGHEVVERTAVALESEVARNPGVAIAARVVVSGTCPAAGALAKDPERWIAEVRRVAAALGDVWVEKVKLETLALAVDTAAGDRDEILTGLLADLAGDAGREDRIAALREAFADLAKKLPREIVHGEDSLDLTDQGLLGGVLGRARDLLAGRLANPGGEP